MIPVTELTDIANFLEHRSTGAQMIPVDRINFTGDGHAWFVTGTRGGSLEAAALDRPCDTCGGTGTVHCPGPSVKPQTQMQRNAAGLVMGRDYCYGMHMGHDCPDCIDGRHTFDIEVGEGERCHSTVHRVSVVPGMVTKQEDGTWLVQLKIAQ